MNCLHMKLKSLLKFHYIAAAVCFILAAFLRFALIGYGFSAYVLTGIGLIFILYALIGAYGGKRPKPAKIFRRTLSFLLALFFLIFAAAEIPVILSAHSDENNGAAYLIVLGAGVNGTVPSLSMENRLDAVLPYLERYPETVVIVSGGMGPGEDVTEAEAMRIWLVNRGIAPERIIKEENATSTFENIAFPLDLLPGLCGSRNMKVAIATSEYHLYRAKLIAKDQGARPVGVAAKTTLPVLKVNYFIREAFAVWYLWFDKLFQ